MKIVEVGMEKEKYQERILVYILKTILKVKMINLVLKVEKNLIFLEKVRVKYHIHHHLKNQKINYQQKEKFK